MFDVISYTFTGSCANGATATITYPTGRSKGNFTAGSGKHKAYIGQNEYSAPGQFTLTFNANASSITFTNNTGSTIASGETMTLNVDRRGVDKTSYAFTNPDKMIGCSLVCVDLGSPNAAAANNVWTSAALTTATCEADAGSTTTKRPAGYVAPAGGALVSSGIATLDVPRNVVASWTGTAAITVYGFDEYGQAMLESSASGTSLTGSKAFKTVVGIKVDANVTGLTVGTGTKLGLPVFLPGSVAGHILKEIQDGAAATAGTPVAGILTAQSATTGDVRGTYTPNAAPDGDKGYSLILALPDPSNKGIAQYAG